MKAGESLRAVRGADGRLNEDDLEIQLVRVDQAGGVHALGGEAAQFQQGPAGAQAAHHKPVGRERQFQGVVWPERRLGLRQRAGDFLHGLVRQVFGRGEGGGRGAGGGPADGPGVHAAEAATPPSPAN